jgi:hypothetical protein
MRATINTQPKAIRNQKTFESASANRSDIGTKMNFAPMTSSCFQPKPWAEP